MLKHQLQYQNEVVSMNDVAYKRNNEIMFIGFVECSCTGICSCAQPTNRPPEGGVSIIQSVILASYVDINHIQQLLGIIKANNGGIKALSTIIEGMTLQYAGSLTTRTPCTQSFRQVDTNITLAHKYLIN